jgi:hypothetical protein
VGAIPAREPEAAVDELVPVLEVDREQQRRHAATVVTYAGPKRGAPAATTRPLPASFAR